MDCLNIEDLISAYLENELSPDLHREVSDHLDRCDACRALKEKVEELMDFCPELEEEVPFFLANRLYYIPERIETARETATDYSYLQWIAAMIGTVVLFLNLFYFTNLYPSANRFLHDVTAQIKTLSVETGAIIEKVTGSAGASLLAFSRDIPEDHDDPQDPYPDQRDRNKNNFENKHKNNGGNGYDNNDENNYENNDKTNDASNPRINYRKNKSQMERSG